MKREQVALVVSICALVAAVATAIIGWRTFEDAKPSIRVVSQIIPRRACPTLRLVAVNEGGSAVSLASATYQYTVNYYVHHTITPTRYVSYLAPVSATGTPPGGIRPADPIYVPSGGDAVFSTTFDPKSFAQLAPFGSLVLTFSVADYTGDKWSGGLMPVSLLLRAGKDCRTTRSTSKKK